MIARRIAQLTKNFIGNPAIRFGYLSKLGFYNWMSDEEYLKKAFQLNMGKELDLEEPKTFNEKLQWLKLYDRKAEYTKMVDKYEVKQLVADRIGAEHIIPTLGVWDGVEDIDFGALPHQFVLKSTHDSGGLAICRDKVSFDVSTAKKNLSKSLKRNYFWQWREWPYRDVKPKIIAEKYMQDADITCLPVYKVFCFGGEPYLIQAIQNDKCADESIDYFDVNWNLLNLRQNFPNSAVPFARPYKLEEMLEKSRVLANDMSFIRVDWYVVNGELYFSEYTFYSDAGVVRFEPEEWDYKLGAMIALPPKG